MTDNEIIKALECLSDEEIFCNGCVCHAIPYPVCRTVMAKHTLDLIKRQREEIEKLKNEKVKHHFIATAVIDEDVLKKFMDEWLVIKIRNEAIKEFAERAKILVIPQKTAEGYTREIILKSDFDSLVKEITE